MQYSTEGGSPIYSLTHSGLNQIEEGYWGFVDEMTDILCSDKGTRQNREGIKTQDDITIIEQNSLALEIATNRQIGDTNYRIRKFDGKWYPLVTARIGDMAVGQFPYTSIS